MSGFSWIEPKSSRGSNPDSSHLVSVTVSPELRDGGRSSMRMAIAIYPAGLKLTRWIKGDKVVIGYDNDSKMLAIKRCSHGYALSHNGGSKKSNSVRVSAPAPEKLEQMKIYRPTQNDVQMIDGMLVISLKKGN